MTIFKWLWWFPVFEASLLFTRSNLVYSKWNVEWCRYSQKFNLTIFAIYPNNFLLLCDVDTVWEVYELGTSCVLTICPDFYFSNIPPVFWSDVKYFLPPVTCLFCVEYFSTCVLCRCYEICDAAIRRGKPHWGPFYFNHILQWCWSCNGIL